METRTERQPNMNIRRFEARVFAALPQDKCIHALAGALIFAIAHILSLWFGMPSWVAPPAVGIAGTAKEALDSVTGGDPSIFDLLATISGGAIALLASL
jgi:hypothetical protein